jgi:hypothetical protein
LLALEAKVVNGGLLKDAASLMRLQTKGVSAPITGLILMADVAPETAAGRNDIQLAAISKSGY